VRPTPPARPPSGLVARLAGATALLALAIAGGSAEAGKRESLLVNPGPRFLAGLTLATTAGGPGCHVEGSSLRDAAAVTGRPRSRGFRRSCVGGTVASQDAPSFYNDTRFGWTSADADRVPGWSVEALSGGDGEPVVLRYGNRSQGDPSSCRLREVGLVYQSWPDPVASALKLGEGGRRVRLRDIDGLEARFEARLVSEAGRPQCAAMPSGYITVDFRMAYFADDPSGVPLRSDLVGVVIHQVPGSRRLAGADEPDVYWRGTVVGRANLLLMGDRLPQPTPPLDKTFQRFTIDLAAVIDRLPAPPAGLARGDAVIMGLDIYSAVRGADLVFDVRNVDLTAWRL
jgi:hypothetical protein